METHRGVVGRSARLAESRRSRQSFVVAHGSGARRRRGRIFPPAALLGRSVGRTAADRLGGGRDSLHAILWNQCDCRGDRGARVAGFRRSSARRAKDEELRHTRGLRAPHRCRRLAIERLHHRSLQSHAFDAGAFRRRRIVLVAGTRGCVHRSESFAARNLRRLRAWRILAVASRSARRRPRGTLSRFHRRPRDSLRLGSFFPANEHDRRNARSSRLANGDRRLERSHGGDVGRPIRRLSWHALRQNVRFAALQNGVSRRQGRGLRKIHRRDHAGAELLHGETRAAALLHIQNPALSFLDERRNVVSEFEARPRGHRRARPRTCAVRRRSHLYQAYAAALGSQAKFADAETYARKAIAMRPAPITYDTLAGILKAHQRYDEAMEAYAQGAARSGSDAWDEWIPYADTALLAGRPQAAYDAADRILAESPFHGEAETMGRGLVARCLTLQGMALVQMLRPNDAIAVLGQAMHIADTDPKVQGPLLVATADANWQIGNREAALAAFRQAQVFGMEEGAAARTMVRLKQQMAAFGVK